MTDTKPKRIALYARVSTKDKGQDVENQLAQLRAFCERKGYVIHDEYTDDESGSKGKRERAGFARLFEDASKGEFDLVLVWELDRFTREGIKKTLFYLEQLEALGINFKSYTQEYLDTDNELGYFRDTCNNRPLRSANRSKWPFWPFWGIHALTRPIPRPLTGAGARVSENRHRPSS